jgi:hypothetical protein
MLDMQSKQNILCYLSLLLHCPFPLCHLDFIAATYSEYLILIVQQGDGQGHIC